MGMVVDESTCTEANDNVWNAFRWSIIFKSPGFCMQIEFELVNYDEELDKFELDENTYQIEMILSVK